MNWKVATIVCAAGLFASNSSAVILYKSATRNTSAPTGQYLNSGWQYQIQLSSGFVCTPIGPRALVMASHIAAATGTGFTWNSVGYTFTSSNTVPGTTDLAILTVDKNLPSFAPIYNETTDGSLVGKTEVIFGRGTQRGNPVNLATAPRAGESTLRGWEWGTYDSVLSWGTNTIDGFTSNGTANAKNYVYYDFDAVGTSDECTLSSGDSAGGGFVKAPDGVWKLVSTNSAVESPYRLTQTGADISAAIFDKGNLWQFDGANYVQNIDSATNLPSFGVLNNVTNYLSYLAPYIPVAGDANYDGKVNTADFNLMAAHFGQSTFNWIDGDFNHDGIVNSTDYTLYLSKYGYSGAAPLSGPLPGAVVVPEPASAAFLLAIFGLASRCVRRY